MKTAERQRWLSFLRQDAGDQYEADARHGRMVRIAKVALPSGAGLIVLLLLVWPALISGESGFTLAFNEIKNRDDTLRMVQPRFEGVD
ncbi:MAG: hypothetical protein R3360_06585, partial [Alphaproteobacteria bacterium]|nr:hypothetical protein [Alphaproteobacteria bacterium]